MNTTKLIKYFVLLEVVLAICYMALFSHFQSLLPGQLTDYVNSIEYASLSFISKSSWWLTGLSFILYVVSVVLLLLTKSVGKWTYLATIVVSLVATPNMGHVIQHSYLSLIGSIDALNQGAILALLFMTESEYSKPRLASRSTS